MELARAAEGCARFGGTGAICVLDIDNFRLVNDAHGQALGDQVLVAVAARLRERLRVADVLARTGSDEFAVLLPATPLPAARGIAAELLSALRSIRVGAVQVTASLGIAPLQAGLAASELLADAVRAMIAAKEAGRDRLAVADPDGRARVRDSLTWASRIRDALEFGEFEVHAQPIVTLADGRRDRYELLVRLRGSSGPIGPTEFLPTAERFGQIQAIDGWVVGHALGLLARMPGTGPVLHVNLAPSSIGDAELMSFIERAVVAAAVDPARLVFEITETAAIADLRRARRTVERLRGLGCQIALDDFGTGFGSFSHLKNLPIDLVKIAGEFVEDLPNSLVDRVSVRAMAEIAEALGMRTVAEYVTDEATVEILRELRVDFAQGWHTGRPQPADALWL